MLHVLLQVTNIGIRKLYLGTRIQVQCTQCICKSGKLYVIVPCRNRRLCTPMHILIKSPNLKCSSMLNFREVGLTCTVSLNFQGVGLTCTVSLNFWGGGAHMHCIAELSGGGAHMHCIAELLGGWGSHALYR